MAEVDDPNDHRGGAMEVDIAVITAKVLMSFKKNKLPSAAPPPPGGGHLPPSLSFFLSTRSAHYPLLLFPPVRPSILPELISNLHHRGSHRQPHPHGAPHRPGLRLHPCLRLQILPPHPCSLLSIPPPPFPPRLPLLHQTPGIFSFALSSRLPLPSSWPRNSCWKSKEEIKDELLPDALKLQTREAIPLPPRSRLPDLRPLWRPLGHPRLHPRRPHRLLTRACPW